VTTTGEAGGLPPPGDGSRDARLRHIRRGARALAAGLLDPIQARRTAAEIERLAADLLAPGADAPAPEPRMSSLSTREREVLVALASGRSVQEVAFCFQRSPKTVNNQRTSVLRKLGLRNTAELTRFAIRSGLLHP